MGLHALVDAASEIVEAASALHHTWDHSQLLTDPSGSKAFGSFMCAEADALARLLCALSMHETAEGVIRQHARSDEDESDRHHSTYLLVQASDLFHPAPIVSLGGVREREVTAIVSDPSSAAALDFDARYELVDRPGIAWRLLRWAELPGPDLEDPVESDEWVVAVMVGDDREETLEVERLRRLADGESDGSCGQVGCEHDGRDS